MVQLQRFKTLVDLLTYFNDEQVCRDYLELLRWPEGLRCAYKDCNHDKVCRYSNGKTYKCYKIDEFVFRYNTRTLTEADRFNLMLSGLATHLPYSKLIENEKKQPVRWFNDAKSADRGDRYQQSSFGF